MANDVAGTAGFTGNGLDENQTSPIKAPDQKLVIAALDAFFAEQQSDGLWVKGQPIYKSFRKGGRNVGNAFVFAVDTVAALLENIPAPLFRPHMNHLEKLLSWIEDHQKVDVFIENCDSEDGKCFGKVRIVIHQYDI